MFYLQPLFSSLHLLLLLPSVFIKTDFQRILQIPAKSDWVCSEERGRNGGRKGEPLIKRLCSGMISLTQPDGW